MDDHDLLCDELLSFEDDGASSSSLGYDCAEVELEPSTAGVEEMHSGNEASLRWMVSAAEATRPNPSYLVTGRSLTVEMRLKLVHWAFMAQLKLDLSPLSTALAVNFMDRFFSKYPTPPTHAWSYQLAAIACVSIAAKMEEACPPSLRELQDLPRLPAAATVDLSPLVARMELLVLDLLGWSMNSITPLSLLDRVMVAARPPGSPEPPSLRAHCRMLLYTATMEASLLAYPAPSLAAGAVVAGMVAAGEDPRGAASRLCTFTGDTIPGLEALAMKLEAALAAHGMPSRAAAVSPCSPLEYVPSSPSPPPRMGAARVPPPTGLTFPIASRAVPVAVADVATTAAAADDGEPMTIC